MNEFQHRVAKQVRILTIVEAPRHFVKVGREVFCGDSMPSSHNPALEQTESRLNRVRVDVATDVLFGAMLNRLMLVLWHASPLQSKRVTDKLIRHNYVNIVADVLFDVLSEGASFHVSRMEEAKIAAALPDADYRFLGFLASVNAPSDFLSAYIGFVYLNFARQFLKGLIFGHCVPDTVTEIPRCAVVNSQHTVELVRRHPFLGLAKQVDSKEPFRERKVSVMEDRSRSYGELIAA